MFSGLQLDEHAAMLFTGDCHSPVQIEPRVCLCRPGSAAGGTVDSGAPEAAGLYWRKHRLVVPAGYAMTAQEAQAAVANPTITARQDCTSNSAKPVSEGVPEASSAGCLNDTGADISCVEAGLLAIEDAAELTHDRAAAILRQLSHECEAAASKPGMESSGEGVAAADGQYPVHTDQALPCHSAPHETAEANSAMPAWCAHAEATTSGIEGSASNITSQPARQEESVERGVAFLQAAQAVSSYPQHHVGDNAGHAADLNMQTGAASLSQEQESLFDEVALQTLGAAASAECTPDHSAWRPTDLPQRQLQSVPAAVPAAASLQHEAALQSPVLQRLQMSKQAAFSGSGPAGVQPSDGSFRGEHHHLTGQSPQSFTNMSIADVPAV